MKPETICKIEVVLLTRITLSLSTYTFTKRKYYPLRKKKIYIVLPALIYHTW